MAGAVLAVSLLPLTGDGMDATRACLALMHLSVAAALIPVLGGRHPGAGAGVAGGSDTEQPRGRAV